MNRRVLWRRLGASAAALPALSLAGCHRHSGAAATTASSASGLRAAGGPPPAIPGQRLQDVTAAANLHFTHSVGPRSSLLPEDMGSGLAWGDYDNDGYPDLYVVNQPGAFASGQKLGPGNRLFRNYRDGTFTDVTEEAGLGLLHFGMGAFWGDYDNDGYLDLFVTGQDGCYLFHNEGNGRFRDVTKQSGVFSPGWSTGAVWFDFDNDGWLDLYVAHYVDYPRDIRSQHLAARPQYNLVVPPALNPESFDPQPNRLFRNNRNGTFTDVTARAGVADADGRSLTVIAADFGLTGHQDLYVGNDLSMNRYFAGAPGGRFLDRSTQTWLAENKGTMGFAAADIDGDGDLDLYISHWLSQGDSLYQNLCKESPGGPLTFTDIAEPMQLAYLTLPTVSWGCGFLDLDNAGRCDLLVVNGNTLEDAQDHNRLVAQRPYLFRHADDGYHDAVAELAPQLNRPLNARGFAMADFDRDGDLDFAISCNRGPLLLFRADGAEQRGWLKVNLRGTRSNRQGIGARVTVIAQGKRQMQSVGSQGSYLSQHATELHFGLGEARTAELVQIDWPSGRQQLIHNQPARQVLHITEE